MASKRAKRLAGEWADEALSKSPVMKSYGTRDLIVKAFTPLAQNAVTLEKSIKSVSEGQAKLIKGNKALIEREEMILNRIEAFMQTCGPNILGVADNASREEYKKGGNFPILARIDAVLAANRS